MTELTARELLVMLFEAALDAVDGQFLVNQWCRSNKSVSPQQSIFTHCVAIGKVAAPMLQGALDSLPTFKSALLISPPEKITRQLKKHKNVKCIASSHPIPDERSIDAGKALIHFLSNVEKNDNILFLISGGTSSLVEVLPDRVKLETLQKVNKYLLASGMDIYQVNSWRKQFSQIKGGGLLNWVKAKSMTQLLLSDVKEDKVEVIGSGLLVNTKIELKQDVFLSNILGVIKNTPMVNDNNVQTHIIGNIDIAMEAVSEAAQAEGLESFIHEEFLEKDASIIAEKLYTYLKDAPLGIHVWAGESTVVLPDNPGIGGRNQTFALTFSKYINQVPNLHLLSAGTDGVDGNSNCAGAIVSSYTSQKAKRMGFDIDEELNKANAGMLLMATDDLINVDSKTNVMDLIIVYKM